MSTMPHPLTREQRLTQIYRHTHRDYKGTMLGRKTINVLRAGGTCLVMLDDLTDAEIDERMPYVLKKEAIRVEAWNRLRLEAKRARDLTAAPHCLTPAGGGSIPSTWSDDL